MDLLVKLEKDIGAESFKMVKTMFDTYLDETNMETFKSMKKILNKTFGEANNQIVKPDVELANAGQIDQIIYYRKNTANNDNFKTHIASWLKDHFSYHIIIKFPEVEITNSRKQSHAIKDLFVRFKVRPDGRLTGVMQGTRTTLSAAEASVGYLHSHLNNQHPPDIGWGHFCLGSGEIQQPLAVLRTEYSDINFTLLCLQLQNYVVWESLEGTPHVHMNSVFTRGRGEASNNLNSGLIQATADLIFRKIKETATPEVLMSKLIFNVSPRGVQVEATNDFEMWIAALLQQYDLSNLKVHINRRLMSVDQLLALKDTNTGKYYTIGNSRAVPNAGNKTVVRFKDEDIKLKILPDEEKIDREKYPNPDITKYICEKLRISITKCAFDYKETAA